ncbi:beta-ketoacyl synthase N-terminal-like domain-containing protein [Micromonospora narathiwatensis]|uniref:Ketoacyl-synthetase C-terminal extension n=1 Tax=Micromonospora narathiwatensis TaxID=299146 RepID=A0A1A8ZJ76_9ACTN|nr:type I polyketide synthase [Micromonospora narathiwatensis]SBT43942.1 Ketoacyl-synthetase C-terminal extension [Micromonospora narathiwatensis]
MISDDDDRIAVIGLACRVPGAVDAAALWRNVRSGVDSVRRFSRAEALAAGVPAEVVDDASFVPAFGHLDGLTDFDAGLFGYRDDEAALLDPQHRLFLEVTWWALEDAGLGRVEATTQVGVFAGCGVNRYLRHHLLGNPAVGPAGGFCDDWDDILAGASSDYLPTRAAYALGLSGPAVAIQSACSSSLVAVCQAAQSLLDFRCDVAVAGGASVVSTHQTGYRYRAGGTLAADGVCRPYDADATGQVFGNGAGAVVLKRLADAVDDGDHVYAVLAGWAVNNDGADRAGFTVPGVVGQSAVVAEALAAADWHPDDLGYVEGHGSGTAVGDAIEIDALTRAFRTGTARRGFCALGSLKSNVGNLDAAAGVAGLIKTVLAVHHGVIPGTLHFTRAHRDVDLAGGPFVVTTDTRPWTGARRAGVSSFGLGGTNAHVLVEQAPTPLAYDANADWAVLPLSAATDEALRVLAARLADHLAGEPGGAHADAAWSLTDVAYTLAVGRRRLPHREAVVARDVAQAVGALRAVADGRAPSPPAEAPGEFRDRAAGWRAGGDLPGGAGRRVPLPGYPFQRRRHWIDRVGTPQLAGGR